MGSKIVYASVRVDSHSIGHCLDNYPDDGVLGLVYSTIGAFMHQKGTQEDKLNIR